MKKSDFAAAEVQTFRQEFDALLAESFGANVLQMNLDSAEPFWFLCRPKGWSSKHRLNYKPLLHGPHVVDIECYDDLEFYAQLPPPIGAQRVVLPPTSVSFKFLVPEIDIRAPFAQNTAALSVIVARMAQLKIWFEALG